MAVVATDRVRAMAAIGRARAMAVVAIDLEARDTIGIAGRETALPMGIIIGVGARTAATNVLAASLPKSRTRLRVVFIRIR